MRSTTQSTLSLHAHPRDSASHYTGTLEVKPKGSGSTVEWRVQFLPDDQPDIVVRTMVSTLLKTGLESLKLALRERA